MDHSTQRCNNPTTDPTSTINHWHYIDRQPRSSSIRLQLATATSPTTTTNDNVTCLQRQEQPQWTFPICSLPLLSNHRPCLNSRIGVFQAKVSAVVYYYCAPTSSTNIFPFSSAEATELDVDNWGGVHGGGAVNITMDGAVDKGKVKLETVQEGSAPPRENQVSSSSSILFVSTVSVPISLTISLKPFPFWNKQGPRRTDRRSEGK